MIRDICFQIVLVDKSLMCYKSLKCVSENLQHRPFLWFTFWQKKRCRIGNKFHAIVWDLVGKFRSAIRWYENRPLENKINYSFCYAFHCMVGHVICCYFCESFMHNEWQWFIFMGNQMSETYIVEIKIRYIQIFLFLWRRFLYLQLLKVFFIFSL